MDVLGDIPGLPGVFIAGVFSAALRSVNLTCNLTPDSITILFIIRRILINLNYLFHFSSLSTSLNSMSAVVLEDFYKPFFKKELSERESTWLMRGVVILLGTLCVGKYCI